MSVNDPYHLHQPEPLLIVISGPSGVGKDTVIQHMRRRQTDFYFVVTMTDRAPREKEVDGVDYIFVSTEKFKQMIVQGEMLEHALVYGDLKGVPKSQVRQAFASRKDVVMRVDVQGALTIRSLCPEAVLILLAPENKTELRRRLKLRRTEPAVKREARLQLAESELRQADRFDYVVINRAGQLDETVAIIQAIITAEHHRLPHRKVAL